MKWIDVVKKHLKLNPGKSLKDVMPDIKKEYYSLTGTPKKHHKKHHKKTVHKRKSRKGRKSRKRRR